MISSKKKREDNDMQTGEAIRARRSVRKYKAGAAVPPEHVKLMLEAAMMAPSAVNSRPWEFYVVERRETLERLMQAHPACKMLETATLAIAVCGRPDLQPGRGFWPQDCGAAVENILTKSKQKGPALKGAFCAPCGSSSLQYLCGYCCFVCRPNSSQNALFQGAKQSQAGRLPQMQGKARR